MLDTLKEFIKFAENFFSTNLMQVFLILDLAIFFSLDFLLLNTLLTYALFIFPILIMVPASFLLVKFSEWLNQTQHLWRRLPYSAQLVIGMLRTNCQFFAFPYIAWLAALHCLLPNPVTGFILIFITLCANMVISYHVLLELQNPPQQSTTNVPFTEKENKLEAQYQKLLEKFDEQKVALAEVKMRNDDRQKSLKSLIDQCVEHLKFKGPISLAVIEEPVFIPESDRWYEKECFQSFLKSRKNNLLDPTNKQQIKSQTDPENLTIDTAQQTAIQNFLNDLEKISTQPEKYATLKKLIEDTKIEFDKSNIATHQNTSKTFLNQLAILAGRTENQYNQESTPTRSDNPYGFHSGQNQRSDTTLLANVTPDFS